jgi:hypothetical protein
MFLESDNKQSEKKVEEDHGPGPLFLFSPLSDHHKLLQPTLYIRSPLRLRSPLTRPDHIKAYPHFQNTLFIINPPSRLILDISINQQHVVARRDQFRVIGSHSCPILG